MDDLILVVDDARFARTIAKRALQNGGFDHVIEAVSAADAREKFISEKPALTLLDITLPDNSDLTFLEELLSIQPDAKIIMNSAIGQELIIDDAIKAGAKGFITKPFDEKDFLATINAVLKQE